VTESRRMIWEDRIARIGRRCEVHLGFWWRNMTERDHLEYVGVDGRILKCKFKKRIEGMDWNDLAQDRIRWSAPVTEVMNLRVP
jgi:hypothetical protein